jgi:hypothetical protein
MTVTATITARINSTVASTLAAASNTGPDVDLIGTVLITPGTGAAQADKEYYNRSTLAASASENIDLAGAGTDVLGALNAFAKVKAILVKADPANTNDVIVGGAASNGFVGPFGATTHTIAVRPGGVFLTAHPGTGWTVTAATADLIKILNGGAGTSVTYEICIVGTSV